MRRILQPEAVRVLLGMSIVLSLTASSARAEEITLQNGQKVVGAIVGFENGMFRVETEFGFALIRKDRVRSITFSPTSSKGTGMKAGGRDTTSAPTPIAGAATATPAEGIKSDSHSFKKL